MMVVDWYCRILKFFFNFAGEQNSYYTDNYGRVSISVNNEPGKYYVGISNPVSGEYTIKKITILPQIESHDLVKMYGNSSSFIVRILGLDALPVGAGQTVRFIINGPYGTATYNIQTDSNGYATRTIGLVQGKYNVTTTYNGCSVFNTIKVFFTSSDIDDEMSSLSSKCYEIRRQTNGADEDVNNFEKCANDFGYMFIVQGIAFIVLFAIDLMIFIIAFISQTCGEKCTFECCTLCQKCPQLLEGGISCYKCIVNAAFKNPVLLQFIIGILCLCTTIAMLSLNKKGESLSTKLAQKYSLGGYDSRNINGYLVIVIVFLIVIIISTIIYWILSKCYFNKIDIPNTKENMGNSPEANVTQDSSKIEAYSNEQNNNMATNSEFKQNTYDFKGITNLNINNEANSNVNEARNQVNKMTDNIIIENDATKKDYQITNN